MKLLLLLLLLIPIYSFSQEIPKGADRIELQTTLSDSLLYEAVSDLLSEEGWAKTKTDDRRKEITTDYKRTKHIWRLRMLINVKQGVVTIRGQSSVSSLENEPTPYKGMGGGMYKVNFEYMNKFALRLTGKIDGATISYPLANP